MTFRLTKEEHAKFTKLVELSKDTKERYIRAILKGIVPVPALPIDYYEKKRELYAIGNNMNQIARKAHALGVVDAESYDECYKELCKRLCEIDTVVRSPKKLNSSHLEVPEK